MSSLSYQILVSTMKQTDFSIYNSMNLNSDAIIVNQGDKNLFEFVRVDLYERDGKVLFGEMTFSPACYVFPYFSNDFDRDMGKKFEKGGIECT